MEEEDFLIIPLGLNTRTEIFDGFGNKELIKSLITIGCFSFIDLIIYIVSRNIATVVLFFVISVAISITVFVKDKNNISVADTIGFMIRFSKSQKFYKYKYYDEWKW